MSNQNSVSDLWLNWCGNNDSQKEFEECKSKVKQKNKENENLKMRL